MGDSAPVIWLTGISGSGKTTLAREIVGRMKALGTSTETLDGDIVRDFFEGDLGYSPSERAMNVRRIAFAAKLLADHGVTVIVANIAPYYEVRDFIRRKIPSYIQIYLKASIEKVGERDIKGHYGKARAGEMRNLVGVDDRYDVPRNPSLVIETDRESIEESAERLWRHLGQLGVHHG
jgi:adenylylsulfate kinase